MLDMYRTFLRAESHLQLVDHNHRAMSATGTAARQSETALAFTLIEGQSKLEKSIKTIEKHARFQVSEDIFFDFGFEAAACPQFIDKIGIGQKAHIQNHVGIVGN